jgi:hypothetical protein
MTYRLNSCICVFSYHPLVTVCGLVHEISAQVVDRSSRRRASRLNQFMAMGTPACFRVVYHFGAKSIAFKSVCPEARKIRSTSAASTLAN